MKPRIRWLVIVIVSFVFLAGCCRPIPVRLEESMANSTFPHSPELPFGVYVEKTRQMVEKTRQDLDGPDRAGIIAANTPFELVPDPTCHPKNADGKFDNGVLLIHGLSDSPYHMRQIGNHLRGKGFWVRAILLPGHGTVPGDLISVKYGEWIKAVRYGVKGMAPRVERLFVAGFSTGATLGVYHSLVSDDIHGLLLFSPALGVDAMAFLTPWVSSVMPWLDREDDLDFAKYESFTCNAAAQIYKLIRTIDQLVEEGKEVTIPVFAALSYEDATADADSYLEFFTRYVTDPQSRVLLYTAKPLAKFAGDPKIDQVISRVETGDGRQIVDFAHTAITLPSHDPHYGKHGDYRNCLHYRCCSAKRKACLEGKALVLGARTFKNRIRYGNIQRLTYNPFYKEMTDRMDRFLFWIDFD